jgi:hypothetical protein
MSSNNIKEISIKWTIPFDILDILYTKKRINTVKGSFYSIYAIDLIDFFITRLHINKDKVQLNSRWLKSLYGNQYPAIMFWLLDNNIIELHKNYSVGYKSKVYKLKEDVKINGFIASSFKLPINLDKKKQQWISKKVEINHSFDINVINHLNWSLSNIQLNKNDAINVLQNLNIDKEVSKINLTNIDKIISNNLYSNFDKHGRFHTNYTTLKKEIRQSSLTINNNKITELDINNSQPFFLLLIMHQNAFKDTLYVNDVINGVIYDKIVKVSQIERKVVKKEVFKILYGRNNKKKKTNIELAFECLYPDTYKWLIEWKKTLNSYKEVAHQLQKIESNFIFKNVIPKIIEWKKIPIITVHDSIIFEECYFLEVNIIWNQCLKTILN